MGKAINLYMPEVESWNSFYFVTLTLTNCTESRLKAVVEGMKDAFEACRRKIGRESIPFKAIKKLECTYGKGYHPHYHVIVESQEAAVALRDYWLEFCPKYTRQTTSANCQLIQEGDPRSLIELFKYATKLIAKSSSGSSSFISPKHLDVIFRALRHKRTYQTYGFRVKGDVETVKDLESTVEAYKNIDKAIHWMWDQQVEDWIDHMTGEMLIG